MHISSAGPACDSPASELFTPKTGTRLNVPADTSPDRRQKDTRDILRGASVVLVGTVGRMVARVLLIFLASRLFGVTSFGRLGEVVAIIEILAALSTFGLSKMLLVHLAENDARGQGHAQTLVDALFLAGGVGSVLSLPFLLIWPVLFGSAGDVPRIVAICVPLMATTEVALTASRHKRLMIWDTGAKAVIRPWSFLGFACFAYVIFGAPAEAPAWFPVTPRAIAGSSIDLTALLLGTYMASIVASTLFAGVGLWKTYGRKVFQGGRLSIRGALALGKTSFPAAIYDTGNFCFRRLDMVILSLTVGPSVTGLYYMVQQIATVLEKPRHLFEPMVGPVIAQVASKGDVENHVRRICLWVFVIQITLFTVFAVWNQSILGWFNEAFVVGGMVLLIVLLAEIVDGTFGIVDIPLIFEKPKLPPLLILITLGLEVFAIAVLAHFSGAVGAATGFLIAMIGLCGMRMWASQRVLGFRVIGPLHIFVITGAIIITYMGNLT